MVDTNCDPNKVDFAVPANDDATKSIAIIVNYLTAAIAEGLAERQAAKDEDTEEEVTEASARFDAEEGGEDRDRAGRGGRGGRGGNSNAAGGPGGAPRRRVANAGGGGRKPAGGGR